MLGGFGVGFWYMWVRLEIDLGLIFGLGRVLGGLGEVLGRSWELLGDSGAAFGRLWPPKIDF